MNMKRGVAVNTASLPLFDAAEYLQTEDLIQAFLAHTQQQNPDDLLRTLAIIDRARRRWNLPTPGGAKPDP